MESQRQRILSVLKRSLTLTRRERQVILFVLISFLVGDFLLFFRKLSHPRPPTLAAPSAAVEPLESPEALKIDINRAGYADWVRLPGIGPQKAKAILLKRKEIGRFRRLEDLLEVKGIGPKLLERLRPYLKIDTFKQTGGKVP